MVGHILICMYSKDIRDIYVYLEGISDQYLSDRWGLKQIKIETAAKCSFYIAFSFTESDKMVYNMADISKLCLSRETVEVKVIYNIDRFKKHTLFLSSRAHAHCLFVLTILHLINNNATTICLQIEQIPANGHQYVML